MFVYVCCIDIDGSIDRPIKIGRSGCWAGRAYDHYTEPHIASLPRPLGDEGGEGDGEKHDAEPAQNGDSELPPEEVEGEGHLCKFLLLALKNG